VRSPGPPLFCEKLVLALSPAAWTAAVGSLGCGGRPARGRPQGGTSCGPGPRMRSGSITPLLFDEILERMGGAYEFTDVFFKHWLRREFVRLITQTA